jgi:hypothetical protein
MKLFVLTVSVAVFSMVCVAGFSCSHKDNGVNIANAYEPPPSPPNPDPPPPPPPPDPRQSC